MLVLHLLLRKNNPLPKNLKDKKHWDWPWPFKYIPRSATAFDFGLPRLIAGKSDCIYNRCDESDHDTSADSTCAPKAICPENTWQISWFPDAPWWTFKIFTLYFSFSGKKGTDEKYRNWRIGARYDNEDKYTNYTIIPLPSTRKYTGALIEDTSTK